MALIMADMRQAQRWYFTPKGSVCCLGHLAVLWKGCGVKCVTLNDDAALVGVSAFDVFSLTLVSAFILKANILDLQEGLAADPLGGLRPIQLPPLDSRNRAV